MTITGARTIIVTGKYINFISGAGETGTVTFLTVPPIEAVLPGTLGGSPNSSGPGTFSITLPCTDNTELFPQGFTYIVEERITNLTRTTKGVQIPHTLGSTADLTVILAPYLTPQ
jgi:hypothetical protein